MIVSRHICDDLLYRDPVTMEYKPLLAKSYKWVDNKTLEFELREGIKFHNGEPFDADDVVFTVNYVVNPDNKVLVQQNVDWMEKAEKLGPFKVRITCKKPFPAALEYLSGNVPIYPNEYYAKEGPKGFGLKPVGTGPYKVVEVEQGKRIVFKRNPDYFKESPKGQPAIETIVQRTIPELTTQIAELMTGGVDWIYMLPPDQMEKIGKVPGIETVVGEDMRIAFLQMDASKRCGETPFAKLEVRRAVNHAIDRAAIAKNLVGGASRVVDSACFPTQFGCEQNVMKYDYNPAKAKELLAKAGYPDGFETDFYAYRDRPFAEAMVGYLQGGRDQGQPEVPAVLGLARQELCRPDPVLQDDLGLLRHAGRLGHHRALLQVREGRLRHGPPGARLAERRGHQRRPQGAQGGLLQGHEAHRRAGLLGAALLLCRQLRVHQGPGVHPARGRGPALFPGEVEIG